ncbi:MAG TPA: hypothetical protein VH589_08650 [Trebonia sp.]|jgi:hypothetical protein
MAAAELALLGGILATMITALAAILIAYYQRRSALQDEHRARAFERHLAAYERIYEACRSVQDALNDYVVIDRNAADRSDTFLRQVLDILRTCAYQYCSAVDWRYSPGMAYLDIVLEEKCLRLRDLLLAWLSKSRLSHGYLATVRRDGLVTGTTVQEIRKLNACDYQELRIERETVVVCHKDDAKLISDINKTAAAVVKDLKAVISH